MRTRLLHLTFSLLLCLFPTHRAYSYGAVAIGLHPDYAMTLARNSTDRPTKDDADYQALTACRNDHLRNCSILVSFVNACTATFIGASTHKNYVAVGATNSDASSKAYN